MDSNEKSKEERILKMRIQKELSANNKKLMLELSFLEKRYRDGMDVSAEIETLYERFVRIESVRKSLTLSCRIF